jgi:hypothetical protein
MWEEDEAIAQPPSQVMPGNKKDAQESLAPRASCLIVAAGIS